VSQRNSSEADEIKQNAARYMKEITDVLAFVNRQMILIFKTNDLLRFPVFYLITFFPSLSLIIFPLNFWYIVIDIIYFPEISSRTWAPRTPCLPSSRCPEPASGFSRYGPSNRVNRSHGLGYLLFFKRSNFLFKDRMGYQASLIKFQWDLKWMADAT
jgi:hypothetical protein